jgi:spore maturation protein SpmA
VNRVFVVLLVAAVVVALLRDALPAPLVATVIPPPPPPASCAAVVVAGDGALRAAAQLDAAVVVPVRRGESLVRTGGTAHGAVVEGRTVWHEVRRADGAHGFVSAAVADCPADSAMKALTQKMLDAAADAAKLALGLVGVLALWSGLMRVAERAGLVALLARALRPLLVRLFPDVPPEHPAMGAIVMNMAANMLGLGNAATPLGLNAMKQLQELNPAKKTASNAMVLFLALNTTHLTLIPAKTIALRLENGSTQATNIVLPTILATACGMLVATVLSKLLETRFPVDDDGNNDATGPRGAGGDANPSTTGGV